LRLLEERRNTFSTVNRLPTETLTTIFEALQDNHVFNDLFPPATEQELAKWHLWMVVTQVCGHWRRIALSTPTLWKNVHVKRVYKALDSDMEQDDGRDCHIPILLIERSRPASLNFSCTVDALEWNSYPPPEQPDRIYNSLMDNVHRLESFHLSSGSYLDQTLLDILDTPLLHLSSLQLRVEYYQPFIPDIHTGALLEAGPEDIELPRLFGGGPSNLRKLSLWCYTSWPCNTFPRLTHLSLHDRGTTTTLDQFLDILEVLPGLEILHLERAGPVIPPGTVILTQRRIQLPNLREARFLVFEPDPMNIQYRILECVTMPPFIEILFSLPQSDETDLRMILPGFPFCDQVTDIKIIPPDLKAYSCTALKLRKTQLIIQTGPVAVALYLPYFGAQFPRLASISFQDPFLLFDDARELANFNNLITITINGGQYFHDILPLIRLLKDQTSDDVLCPRLSRVTIYVGHIKEYCYSSDGSESLAGEFLKNSLKVFHREPNKEFEVLIEEEKKIEPLNVRWIHR